MDLRPLAGMISETVSRVIEDYYSRKIGEKLTKLELPAPLNIDVDKMLSIPDAEIPSIDVGKEMKQLEIDLLGDQCPLCDEALKSCEILKTPSKVEACKRLFTDVFEGKIPKEKFISRFRKELGTKNVMKVLMELKNRIT